MASVSAREAKVRFGQLLRRVMDGEDVVITRHDKPVARLVAETGRDLKSVRQAAQAIRGIRKSIAAGGKSGVTLAQWRRAVREGRK